MKWLTWENIGVDRMACAWLILRFIDADAKFMFIPVGQTPLPQEHEPFDIPGVRLTHRGGHCTFHTMLREYQLNDPVLSRIATIIDEADTAQDVTLEPIAGTLDEIRLPAAHLAGIGISKDTPFTDDRFPPVRCSAMR